MNSELSKILAFLIKQQALFTLESLSALDQAFSLVTDDEDAEDAFYDWLKTYKDYRDTFDLFNPTRGGLKSIKPSSGEQTGVRNTFPELREAVKEIIKAKSDSIEDSPQPDI